LLPTQETDASELVTRAKDGDEQAMSELITVHKNLVFTVIYRMVNDFDTSQDLTQETFIRAFLHIKKVKNYQHFRAWVCRIARNLVYSHFRREKRQHTVSLEEINEISGPDGLEKTRVRMILQDALARLSERDRMLLVLTYYQGLTMVEVADVLDLSALNARVALHRARQRLRRELKGHEEELLST
jgi:RNA polymerase sigma-70 factor (ECF subfamily)